ncbi:MAG: hypothetical protein JW395_2741 [Nitrospira sp.]|nr:hypothetical protein [Nitrospira sp.]
MGDDIPYVLQTGNNHLIELPTDWTMDDWPQYVMNPDLDFNMQPKAPERAMEVFQSEFDTAWDCGSLWETVWHPFVSGRPARLAQVEKLIQHMMNKGNVWIATLLDLAEYTQKLIDEGTYIPYAERVPQYDGVIKDLRPNGEGA